MRNDFPGGIAAVGLLIFLAGAGCNNAWSDDEVKTVTKTQVKVIKVPDTHVIKETKIKRVQVPIPQACTEALDSLKKIRSHDDALADSTQDMLALISEAHRIMATGSAPEMVPVTEKMSAARQAASNASIDKAQELLAFDSDFADCQKALDDK